MKEGWEIKKLSEVCSVITDGTHQTPKYFDSGYIFLSSRNVTSGKIDWENVKYLDEDQHNKMYKRLAPRLNDILLAKNGTTGVAAIVDRDEVFDIYVSLALLRPVPKINPHFLLYFINSPLAKKQFNKRLKGIGVPNLHLKEIREVKMSFPNNFREQKKIVTILDEAFAAIDQAKANIEKNIQNAEELFQSKLNQIFSQKGESWEEKRLVDVCILQRGFDLPKRLRNKGKYPLISSSGELEHIDEFKIKGPGVVTGRSGSIGNVFYVNDDFWPLNTTLYIKEFYDNLERYVYYILIYFDLNKYASGSGVPTLNRNFVHNEIVLTTENKIIQKQTVKTLDNLREMVDDLKCSLENKINLLEELKKSLLQKAFNGELTKDYVVDELATQLAAELNVVYDEN